MKITGLTIIVECDETITINAYNAAIYERNILFIERRDGTAIVFHNVILEKITPAFIKFLG
ncbi:MAG: hypothetical protein KCHDKBKB_02977 [Elusimicrobia bacterium]|nr:hypothetical protein [Elusimicrobiota bacterium]